MDRTLNFIKEALKADPDFTCSMTEPLGLLLGVYQSDPVAFDKMAKAIKEIATA